MADNILRTYSDESRKEDVLGLVEILTAKENWFVRNLRKGKVTDTIVSTLTDTLATAASGAVAETGDYTAAALTTPSKLTNLVEVVAKPYKVDRTQNQIEKYTGENELRRQTTKKLAEWGNSAEFDIVRSTLVSGASGTTPKMSGIIEATSKSTNHTSQTSGTVFSASILKGLMKANWDNSNGNVATDIFVGSYLSDKIDDFTNKSYTVVNGTNEKTIVNSIDLFETGLGKVRKHTHRYVQQSGDATARVLAVNSQYLEVGYLQKPFIDTGLARSGDYDFRAIVGKLTLRVRNQDVHWFADGFAKS